MKKRMKVDKQKSAKEFRRNVSQTKSANVVGPRVQEGPMRGGWRL